MRFSINRDHVVSETVAGETTLVNTETTYYYGLNATGTFIWDLLADHDATFQEILDAVSAEYELESGLIQSDIERLLEQLTQEQLILERTS